MENAPQDPIKAAQSFANIADMVVKTAEKVATQVTNKLLQQKQYEAAVVQDHHHNGTDSSQVAFQDLAGKKMFITWTIPGTSAATATNYGFFFIAPISCTVIEIDEIHQTAGTDGGAVTLAVYKATGTTASGAGTNILAGPTSFNLKGTANTVQTATAINGLSVVRTSGIGVTSLKIGDRLDLVTSGVLTSVANVTVTVTLLI